MKLQPNDIWARRERDGRVAIWINESCLVLNLPRINELKFRTKYRYEFLATVPGTKRKKQDILPDTGASWRFARRNGEFYYDYDRLPDNRRRQLPEKEEILALYEACLLKDDKSTILDELKTYLDDLTPWLPAYSGCKEHQAKHLARACAVLRYAADVVGSQLPSWDKSWYRTLAQVVKDNGFLYLPKNYRRLQQKVEPVVAGAKVTSVIKLPRQGNNNRKPYSDQDVIGWMMYLRSLPQNYSNAYIARKINKMCAVVEKNAPSKSFIEHYFATVKSKFLTGPSRHRGARRASAYKSYIPVAGALHAGDCWQMDGTRFNIIPHLSKDGKEKSLTIIAIRDVHSGDVVGYHLDTKEDRYGYLHALRMAVSTTGHLPYELVHDRFPGHNTQEWLQLTKRAEFMGVKFSITSTATGKSHVERFFSTLQDVFMQDLRWYYGQGVQSRNEAAHRSPEYLKRIKKEARKVGFDFDMAWRGASGVVEKYRNTNYSEYSAARSNIEKTPIELYQESKKPHVKEVDDFRRVELFGTERTVTLRNQGMIKMRIHKVEYTYRVPNYDVISNYKQVRLCYDLEDLTTVHLFDHSDDPNRAYLGEAIEERGIQYYGPNPEFDRLAKMKAARKQVEDRRREELEAITEHVSDDVDLLMTGLTAKTTVGDAESAWLEQHAGVWRDQGETPRLSIPQKTAEPVAVEKDDDDLLELVKRNY